MTEPFYREIAKGFAADAFALVDGRIVPLRLGKEGDLQRAEAMIAARREGKVDEAVLAFARSCAFLEAPRPAGALLLPDSATQAGRLATCEAADSRATQRVFASGVDSALMAKADSISSKLPNFALVAKVAGLSKIVAGVERGRPGAADLPSPELLSALAGAVARAPTMDEATRDRLIRELAIARERWPAPDEATRARLARELALEGERLPPLGRGERAS